MIDFECTYADEQNVYFCNEFSQPLKTYSVEDFEKYVKANNIIPIPERDFEPMGIHSDWFGKFDAWCFNEFVEDNFLSLTKEFYMANNPSEYQSANRIQETRKALR